MEGRPAKVTWLNQILRTAAQLSIQKNPTEPGPGSYQQSMCKKDCCNCLKL